jgi:hypothetical protein
MTCFAVDAHYFYLVHHMYWHLSTYYNPPGVTQHDLRVPTFRVPVTHSRRVAAAVTVADNV